MMRLMNFILYFRMLLIKYFLWLPFIRQTHNPQSIQTKLLTQLLEEKEETTFGKEFRFKEIDNYQECRDRSPGISC